MEAVRHFFLLWLRCHINLSCMQYPSSTFIGCSYTSFDVSCAIVKAISCKERHRYKHRDATVHGRTKATSTKSTQYTVRVPPVTRAHTHTNTLFLSPGLGRELHPDIHTHTHFACLLACLLRGVGACRHAPWPGGFPPSARNGLSSRPLSFGVEGLKRSRECTW